MIRPMAFKDLASASPYLLVIEWLTLATCGTATGLGSGQARGAPRGRGPDPAQAGHARPRGAHLPLAAGPVRAAATPRESSAIGSIHSSIHFIPAATLRVLVA